MGGDNGLNNYARYSSIVFQMILVVLAGAWGGRELDAYFGTGSTWTTILVIATAVLALVYFFWSVTKR